MARMFDEKRDYYRMTADCPMDFKRVGTNENDHGKCINFSAGGILFISPRPVAAGDELEVNITPAMSLVPPLNAIIEVIRCTAEGSQFEVAGSIKEMR